MANDGVGGTAVRRAKGMHWLRGGPLQAGVAQAPIPQFPYPRPAKPRPSAWSELDCVRHLLPRRIVAAAERRASAIGVSAERVLICADAMTEEAYLTNLAHSLGTSYEQFDGIGRADCPLSDDQLIDAAAAGLLPLHQSGGRGLVWIVAPRDLTARRLADPAGGWPQSLRPFRLTSSDRLRQFVARHGQRALGRRAAYGLRLTRPLLSNAPAQGRRRIMAIAYAALAFGFFAAAPLVMIETLSGSMCALFLAAAILRLLSAGIPIRTAADPARIDDRSLPIYTIICALSREAAVVGDLVAALRALDYPGIMAQTPQAARKGRA